MPTETRDAVASWYAERGDLDFSRTEIGVGPHGRPSHATKAYRGAYGYVQMGFYGGTRNWGWDGPRITWYPPEGAHETVSPLLFQDFNIPKGATVQEASVSVFLHSYSTSGQNEWAWKLKVFGLSEPPLIRIPGPTGYDLQYQGECYTQMAGARRWVAQSAVYDACHTSEKVNWDWSQNYPSFVGRTWSPNIAPVINEIVRQDWWEPGARFGLVIAPRGDEMGYGRLYATPDDFPFDPNWPDGDAEVTFGHNGVGGTDGEDPQLRVTW